MSDFILGKCFIQTFLSRGGGGGQTRVLEMLRRGGINDQAVKQNKVKIQVGALEIQGGPLCPPLPKLNPALSCSPAIETCSV